MLQEEERSFTATHTTGKTLLVVADDPEEQKPICSCWQ